MIGKKYVTAEGLNKDKENYFFVYNNLLITVAIRAFDFTHLVETF